MCGFVGFSSSCAEKPEILSRMNVRIVHRGPDAEGYFYDDRVGFGFRRLAIIDLAGGDQPMENEDGSLHVVFNGEIYNYRELRAELLAKGHVFATDSDTEVLLHGYEAYGEGILDRLRGMFAFVLYDAKTGKLFGARDFFGIKPLYYTQTAEGAFVFASEIKSILEYPTVVREVNAAALLPYLTLQYSAAPETFFRGIFKLMPAHCFTYEGGVLSVRRYADVCYDTVEKQGDWAHTVDAAVRESVEAHQISDVPIGAFLSGGVDSAYVTSCMMPEKTFSVGFAQDGFDERREAKALSDLLGIENYDYTVTADDCFDHFGEIQYHMDEPQANPSSVPLYFLARLARTQVKVVLSGEGADELFGGYEWYADTPAMRRYEKLPRFLRRTVARLVKHLPYFRGHDFLLQCSGAPEDYFVGQARVFSEREARAILRPAYRVGSAPLSLAKPHYRRVKGKDALTKKQYLDLQMWMPGDILLKADKMSMAHSLELRVPYLDRHVLACAASLPKKERVDGERTKVALRDASLLTLPSEWANRKKKGFPVPIRYWLREEKYYRIVREAFASPEADRFFDREALLSMLDAHKEHGGRNGRKIWCVYTFLVWYRQFFIEWEKTS